MSPELIEINRLSKAFNAHLPPVLKQITAQLAKGKICGLVGPDGSGKTTLLRLIAGLLLPTEGSVKVGGFDTVGEASEIHRMIGYMPQKFGLYEDLSVGQNLRLYADLRGVVGEDRKNSFEKLLKFTNLAPFTHRLAGRLSGGMKQKLGLACALIKKPALLLLDEPSVGVDPISRKELWQMVEELVKEGITVIWSTAYLDEAEKCGQVLLLNEGKLLYQGESRRLSEKLNGRVFKLTGATSQKRRLLIESLQLPEISDGVIQGKEIRLVIKAGALQPDLGTLKKNYPEIALEPAQPRFEDAFIDLLGGGPGGRSALAEATPKVASLKEEVIIADKLTKKFDHFIAANAVTFTVKKGEIFGLLGPNGAGKSTTFKMMCGLLKPTEGEATVGGFDLKKAPGKVRSKIGYMAQKFSLYGSLSVRQNLDFFSGIYHLAGHQRQEAVERMIKIFNLAPYSNTKAETLSLGFKQRLALSSSTMHHPEILFLDEPTSGVDPITRREFWLHINGLVEKGVTIMVTTHFMDEAEYCDRIALIYRSQIITIGTPDELKAASASSENHNPTLEDAFIRLIADYDRKHPL
ncbi:MAG: ATP-binding cassette domain-containing protein [Parachlamydiales bacterium]|jgi:ABC-2 type transport system ATP-binding protein